MKVRVLVIGTTHEPFVKEGIKKYLQRLPHYCSFEYIELKDASGKGVQPNQQKIKEGETLLKSIKPEEYLCLLDENGVAFQSVNFARHIEKKQLSGIKSWVLVIGGAYGFSEEVYSRANEKIRLSDMTFPHDLVRLILLEQIYRAYTIIRGEGYHHV
ncbi:MAG: 23S rRNA (pseudouridine(1915)-N(3))-methyltransferase RlmH [Bacteroidota bacterium]